MLEMVLGSISGLALFLYGMNLMADGLQKVAGDKLKNIIQTLTRTRLMSVLVGTFVTMIIQSSSATSVMVVGFVNAGLMNLQQALGIIFGANIGTTITGQMVSLNLSQWAPIAIASGLIMRALVKKSILKESAEILIGFGILFIGMNFLKEALSPLRDTPAFADWITQYGSNPFIGDEYIISPNKALLMLNPDLEITSDVQRFMENPVEETTQYQGEFLKGFYLKDCEQFELWMTKIRRYYEQQYIAACHQKIEKDMIHHRTQETETAIRELIAIDEFDERNYQLLMKFYQLEQQRGKAIEIYYELANFLDQELGIEPNDETKLLYENIVGYELQVNTQPAFVRNTTQFWGRVSEIKELERYYHDVTENKPFNALVLSGDTGVGKRTVTRQVLANLQNKCLLIVAECLAEEHQQPLRIWRSIVEQLTPVVQRNTNISSESWSKVMAKFFPSISKDAGEVLLEATKEDLSILSQILVETFQILASERPIVFLVEDCHWMDHLSVQVLQSICSHMTNEAVGMILTKQLGTTNSLDRFIHTMAIRHKLQELQLEPLNQQETEQFIDRFIERSITKSIKQKVYEESEGNLFLLNEYCQQLQEKDDFTVLTPNIIAKMSNRMATLSSFEQEIVKIAACFKYYVSIPLLARILVCQESELIEQIEKLSEKHFLREELIQDEPVVAFTKRIFKTYCYQEHSIAKRRMLHEQIAEQVERLWQHDSTQHQWLLEIAFHYRQANALLKALEYEVKYLQNQLKIQHELFPIYSQQDALITQTEYVDVSEIHEQMSNLRSHIDLFEGEYGTQLDFQRLKMKYLYLEGRYFIRNGDYKRGIDSIQQVIAIAKELADLAYLQEGYRQIIYYCIQVENTAEMQHYIELALDTSIQANSHEAIGILLRLKGLYYLMTGNLESAQQLMKESIATFSITPTLEHKFAINIAASYDYLAEIRQLQGYYEEALEYQQKAIELCRDARSDSSLAIFYVGMGVSYFLLEQYEKSQDCLQRAEELYNKAHFFWKKSVMEVFNVLLDLKRGSYEKAVVFMQRSDDILQRYSSPRDRGLVHYVFALLKNHVVKKQTDNQRIARQLSQSLDMYIDVSISNLNPYRDCYVLEWLEKLKE